MAHSDALDQSSSTRRPATKTRIVSLLTAGAVAGIAVLGTAVPASAAVPSTAELRTTVVKLTNEARAANNCKPLKVSTRLTKAAQGHADDMAAKYYFSHTSADGRTWDARIRAAGWTKPAGENIAYGFDAAKTVMKGWMDSPGHKRNILNCKFNYIGIGYSVDGQYWVQDFGY